MLELFSQNEILTSGKSGENIVIVSWKQDFSQAKGYILKRMEDGSLSMLKKISKGQQIW